MSSESNGATDTAADEKEFTRQEQIWAGLYGPPQAAGLIAKARALRAEQPGADLRALLHSVEPVDEDDDNEADAIGIARPGFG